MQVDPKYRQRQIAPNPQGFKYAILIGLLFVALSDKWAGKDHLTTRDYIGGMGTVGAVVVAYVTERRR